MTADEARKRLSDAVFSGLTVREVVELCAKILGAPLRFTTTQHPDRGILSQDYPYQDYFNWRELVTPAGQMIELYREFLTDEYAFLHGTEPFFFPALPPVERRRILCMAYVGSRRAGHISIPEGDVPLETLDTELIALCARFVALAYFEEGGNAAILGDGRAMELLVSGHQATYQQVASLASDQVFPQKGRYQLLALHLQSGEAQQLTALCAKLTSWLSTNWLIRTKGGAAILLRERRFEAEAWRMFGEQLAAYGCAGCLSPVYEDMMHTRDWYRRLFMLRPLERAQAGAVLRYEDWADYGVFGETGLSRGQLLSFVCEPVRRMAAYDRENGTAYLRTLGVFFEQNANQKKAAEALFLHINTVTYRLQRIRDLFGIALDEPGAFVRLMPSVRLMQYLSDSEGA